MHEYSIVQSLVDRVEEEARARGATGVHRVGIRLGELSGVDPESLATAYHTFRVGTICERAELEVKRLSVAWLCPQCHAEFRRGDPLTCRTCGSPAELAPGGDEILLETIEMEVP